MRNIYKYIDKKYLFPIFLGRIVNSGLVLAQPLILTKALKLDQDGLSYGKILNFVLFGLSVYLVIYSLMLFSNHSHNHHLLRKKRSAPASCKTSAYLSALLTPENLQRLFQSMHTFLSPNHLAHF